MRVREDNRGSSIVTVLVVIAFITILATTLLYISVVNIKTKQADYQNKQSFYVNEITADEIKARFVLEASEAFEKAYKTTMLQYANLSAADRDALYEKTFVEAIESQWEAKRVPATNTNTQIIQNEFAMSAPGEVIRVGAAWIYNKTEGYAQLPDVVISYTDANGNTNMISTDFFLSAPEFDWSIDTYGAWISGVADDRETFQIEDCVIFKNWKKF